MEDNVETIREWCNFLIVLLSNIDRLQSGIEGSGYYYGGVIIRVGTIIREGGIIREGLLLRREYY